MNPTYLLFAGFVGACMVYLILAVCMAAAQSSPRRPFVHNYAVGSSKIPKQARTFSAGNDDAIEDRATLVAASPAGRTRDLVGQWPKIAPGPSLLRFNPRLIS